MNDIERLLRAAAFRLFVADAVRTLMVLLTAGLGLLLVASVVHKLSPWDPPFVVLAASVVAVSVLGALAWAYARRPKGLALADEVDRRAGLREVLSTAVVVNRAEDGWSRSVVTLASERARSVKAGEATPIEAPRHWWVPSALALLLAGMVLVPRHDLTGLMARQEAEAESQRELELVRSEIEAQERTIEAMMERAGLDPEEGAEESAVPESADREPLTADEARRQALRRLTSLRDQLAEQRAGETGRALDSLRDELSKLSKPGPGPLDEFGRRLARGEFSGAKAALEEATALMESGNFSGEQRERMAEQLENLAAQLKELAGNDEALREALAAAGFDPAQIEQMMSSPEALQRAIDEAGDLSESQKQELRQAAEAQRRAQAACQGLGSCLG